MRQIKYILIHEALPENSPGVPRIRRDRDRGYHYIVNADGVVRNPFEVRFPGAFMPSQLRSFDNFNACAIGILLNGSLANESLRPALINLIVELRSHFPEAKILSTFEIDGKTIRPSDAMNQLRLQLSDLP